MRRIIAALLCLSLVVSPVTAKAWPSVPKIATTGVVATCLVYFGLLAPPPPVGQGGPVGVVHRMAHDVTHLPMAIYASVIGTIGVGILVTREVASRMRGETKVFDALMARRGALIDAIRPEYEAARAAYEKAEDAFVLAVEQAAFTDPTARASAREQLAELGKGPAKDRLLAALAEPAPGATPPDAAAAEVTVREAFEALREQYEALRVLHAGLRRDLENTVVGDGRVPTMKSTDDLMQGIAENMREILGTDRLRIAVDDAKKSIDAIAAEAKKHVDNAQPTSLRPWAKVLVPAGLVLGGAYSWPLGILVSAVGVKLAGDNRNRQLRSIRFFTLLALAPTVGYLHWQYLKDVENRVNNADVKQAQVAVEDHWKKVFDEAEERVNNAEAKAFEFAWKRIPDFGAEFPSPVTPSNNVAAPMPGADAVRQDLQKVRAQWLEKYGAEKGAKHNEEYYVMVAEVLATRSEDFRKQSAEEQRKMILFLGRQMHAYVFYSHGKEPENPRLAPGK